MQGAVVSPLIAWQNFYVIIGTAAATLTGLMFVTITLIMGTHKRRSNDTLGAFATPTVVHFCAALLIAALFSAPWQALWNVSLPLGFAGLAGVLYTLIVVRRTLRQNDYKPVLEDWLFHVILPFICYATFVVTALMLPRIPTPVLFAIAAATALFLFIGIHNAWDTVTYLAIDLYQDDDKYQS